jgi:hypothetical protein
MRIVMDINEFEKSPGSTRSMLDLSRACTDQGNHQTAIWLAKTVLDDPDCGGAARFEAFERLTISCYYSKTPSDRDLGLKTCESLSLDPAVPWNTRYLAGQNSTWYSPKAAEIMSGTRINPVRFETEQGWVALNPSIAAWRDELWMVQRTVNYTVTADGKYDTHGDRSVRTRNFLCKLSDDLTIERQWEIGMPVDLPEPRWDLVLGFEDSRLFVWDDQLWTTSTVRELTPEGHCEIVLARLEQDDDGRWRYADWRVINPIGLPRQPEKNWMAVTDADQEPRFLYSSDPVRVIDIRGEILLTKQSPIASDSFRGGGKLIDFDGGRLAIIHQSFVMGDGLRRYLHRFVKYTREFEIESVSMPFRFDRIGIEFAAGLEVHPKSGEILVSAGIQDSESWLITFDPDDIRKQLRMIPRITRDQSRYIRSMESVYGWLLPSTAEIIAHSQHHQSQLGISGDCMEIGTFHGRLFVLLALGLQDRERALGIDVFEDQHLNQDSSGFRFSESVLRSNTDRWASDRQVEILKADSSTLGEEFIAANSNMRWISIDGSHTRSATASDLRLAQRCLKSGGIVAVDDIYRVAWSGVTAGVFEYLFDGGALIPFAIIPNKLLLTTDVNFASEYKTELSSRFKHYHAPHGRTSQEFFADHEILLLKDPSDP